LKKYKITQYTQCPASSKKLLGRTGHQWLTPVILATWRAEIRRYRVQGWPRQKKKKKKEGGDPISKITKGGKQKRTEGVARVVEHLPRKPKAMNFKPQYPQKKLGKKIMCIMKRKLNPQKRTQK
jgi:hypothetical protein